MYTPVNDNIEKIALKIRSGERLLFADALTLWTEAPLGVLGVLASEVRELKNGKKTYYNRNIHIEPTNICSFNCSFCSYKKEESDPEAWSYDLDQIAEIARKEQSNNITEVHIVGGVHPKYDLDYCCKIIETVKTVLPHVSIKAYTAVELHHIIVQSGLSLEAGLQRLMNSGMSAIPGGGAEIFDVEVRKAICPDKVGADQWLEVHRVAHRLGLRTNATILYGHIESLEHRIEHMELLRELQDETGGFDAFIPLKYRNKNNPLGKDIKESTVVDDMKMMAISRLYLDNFTHIKSYWAMLGKQNTQLSLSFGADDVDGTISDTTKIYSMAGVEDQKPTMSVSDMQQLILETGYTPIERDTYYNEIQP